VDTDVLEEHDASIFGLEAWGFKNKLGNLASYKEGDNGTKGEGITKGIRFKAI
jgi:hypothetical protein